MTQEYIAALQTLWGAVENQSDWRIGYNREFTQACERLRELDRQRQQ
jgi:hypothetical protein